MSDLGGPGIEFRWIGNHTMNATKLVMESIDDGGNTSPQSVETSFTPLP